MITTANAFEAFWSLGYRRLVPIIPPDAEVSEHSSLLKRKDARGKAVGVRKQSGKWVGFDWIPHEAEHDDCARWSAMGAGVGIKTGKGLLGIDADTMDPDHARIIRDIVERHCGRLPVRIGNYPKALYVVRCSDEYRYSRVEFGDRREDGSLKDRVEILSDGRQFVAHGIHPVTQAAYYWPREIAAFDDLPEFPAAVLDALLADVQAALPSAPKIIREGSTSEVNQDALKGDPAAVRKAVEATPNTSEHFPTRESYRDFGYAIKAALPDNEREAFEIFADWCARWENGENSADTVVADWRRMKPPFRRGAGWLFEQAEALSGGKFNPAEVWFAPIPDEQDNPFAELRAQETTAKPDPITEMAAGIHTEPYQVPDMASIPPREWLYATHYLRKFASATIAPTAVGKSSLGIVEALSMATNRPLLGVTPRGRFKVWLWNGEDPMDEMDRRIAAAMHHYEITQADIDGYLFVASGRDMLITTAIETKDGTRILEPVMSAVERQIRQWGIDVMVIDPFVSSHQVSENDNNAINAVATRWGRVANSCGCAIELVHHSRKLNGNAVTIEDARGAGALINAVRPARAIMKMLPADGQKMGVAEPWRYFRFVDAKNNLAPPSAIVGGGAAGEHEMWMRMHSVDLGNGDSVGVVTKAMLDVSDVRIDDDEMEDAFRIIGMSEWRYDIRSGARWIGTPIGAALGLDMDEVSNKKRVKDLITELVKQNRLEIYEGRDEKRMPRTCIRAVNRPVEPGQDVFS